MNEYAKRWATLAVEAASMIGQRKTGESDRKRQMVLFAMAEEIVTDLGMFKRPSIPARPAGTPSDDALIREMLRAEAKPGWARDYIEWRTFVANAEAYGARSMELLITARATYMRLGVSEFRTQIALIDEHMLREYQASPPYPENLLDVRRFASAPNRRKDVMPTWALNGEEPRDESDRRGEDQRSGRDD